MNIDKTRFVDKKSLGYIKWQEILDIGRIRYAKRSQTELELVDDVLKGILADIDDYKGLYFTKTQKKELLKEYHNNQKTLYRRFGVGTNLNAGSMTASLVLPSLEKKWLSRVTLMNLGKVIPNTVFNTQQNISNFLKKKTPNPDEIEIENSRLLEQRKSLLNDVKLLEKDIYELKNEGDEDNLLMEEEIPSEEDEDFLLANPENRIINEERQENNRLQRRNDQARNIQNMADRRDRIAMERFKNRHKQNVEYGKTILRAQKNRQFNEDEAKELTILLDKILKADGGRNSDSVLEDAWKRYIQIIPEGNRLYTKEEFKTSFKAKRDIMFQLTAMQSVVAPKLAIREERQRTIHLIQKLNDINDQGMNKSAYVLKMIADRKIMYDNKKAIEMTAKETNPSYRVYNHFSCNRDNEGLFTIPMTIKSIANNEQIPQDLNRYVPIWALYINYKGTASAIYEFIEFGYLDENNDFVKLLRYKRFPAKGIKIKMKAWWGYNETWRKYLAENAARCKFAVRVKHKTPTQVNAWITADPRFSVNASWLDAVQILEYCDLLKDIRTTSFKIKTSTENNYKRSLQKFVNHDNKLLDNLGRMIGGNRER